MRFLLVTWVIVIFIMTCTKNVYRLLTNGEIRFVMAENPHWSKLFTLQALNNISWNEFIGHFMMFFILTALLVTVLQRIQSAIIISFLIGIMTELIQPFFSRGAEGIDVLADTLGITLFAILYVISFLMASEEGLEKGDIVR